MYTYTHLSLSISLSLYIYIYIHTYEPTHIMGDGRSAGGALVTFARPSRSALLSFGCLFKCYMFLVSGF